MLCKFSTEFSALRIGVLISSDGIILFGGGQLCIAWMYFENPSQATSVSQLVLSTTTLASGTGI